MPEYGPFRIAGDGNWLIISTGWRGVRDDDGVEVTGMFLSK